MGALILAAPASPDVNNHHHKDSPKQAAAQHSKHKHQHRRNKRSTQSLTDSSIASSSSPSEMSASSSAAAAAAAADHEHNNSKQQPAAAASSRKLLSGWRDSLRQLFSTSWVAALAPTPELQPALLGAFAELVQGGKQRVADLYIIGGVLGKGHYARVHLGTSLQDGSEWAVKVLPKAQQKSKAREQLKKVVKEVAIMRLLQDHPSAVQLHQVLQDEKNFYLVMENCSGGELFDYAYKLDRLPEGEAAHYLGQLASFLAYAHAKGIVHRDIKPENLMLLAPAACKTADAAAGAGGVAAAGSQQQQQQQQQSFPWRLKVVDYGCSAFILPGQKLHEAVGTVCYVAPEVLQHNYDAQSDVWSAGVVLYMLLCGYLPFDGNNNEETLVLVRAGDFDMDPEDWGHVSQEGQDLVKLLLTYKPAERPTAAQLEQHSWVRHRAAAASQAAAAATEAAETAGSAS